MNSDEHIRHNIEAEARIIKGVSENGCYIAVFPDDGYLPQFAYTIGLFKTYGHPEIICFGLANDLLHFVLRQAHERIKDGQKFESGTRYADFLADYDVQFVEACEEHVDDYFGYASWFYQSWDFPVIQLVWPDKSYYWPWDKEFGPEPGWKFRQPLLDRNTDFKFHEERNLGVITTKPVLAGAPILVVCHDEDGGWQFLCGTTTETENARIVCLEHIVQQDPSVNEVYYLAYGWQAWRDSPDAKWQTGLSNFEEDEPELMSR